MRRPLAQALIKRQVSSVRRWAVVMCTITRTTTAVRSRKALARQLPRALQRLSTERLHAPLGTGGGGAGWYGPEGNSGIRQGYGVGGWGTRNGYGSSGNNGSWNGYTD